MMLPGRGLGLSINSNNMTGLLILGINHPSCRENAGPFCVSSPID